jgi:hypothetical protein
MADIFKSPESIAPLVASQFPEFYQEEGEGFIAFMRAYYEWLDSKYPANILELRDIDRTTDDFIIHFKETYLKNIQFDVATNKRLLIKNSLDLYRAKGTERAVDLFTKLVYGRASSVYYPGDDIFRASDADYVQPKFIEVSGTPQNVNLVGRQVMGTTSGSTAFVEKYIKRKTNVDYIHILYVSNPTADFIPGELLVSDNVESDSPVIIGSVTSGTITVGGTGFAVGDICSFTSDRGRSGLCRITSIGDISGIVEFDLLYGGYGFTTSAQTIVSDAVLTVGSLTTSNSENSEYFPQFADVNQQIVKLTYKNANGTITVGDDLTLKSNNTTTVANGTIVRADIDTNNTGIVYVYSSANSVEIPTITQIAGPYTANVTAVEDQLATATVMGTGNTFQVAVSNTSEVLSVGTKIYQYYPNTNPIGQGTITKVYDQTSADISIDGGVIVSNTGFVTTANAAASQFGFINSILGKTGVYLTNNVFYQDAPVFIANTTTTGTITRKSSGHGAGFNVGSIVNEEYIFRNTDYLMSNTEPRLDSNNNPMSVQLIKDVPLNSYAYGFQKNPQANSGDVLYSYLTYVNLTIGTIATLTNVNPGEDYDETPMVLVYEPAIGAAKRYDYIISYSNATGNFFQGENVYQTDNPNDQWSVTVTDGSTFTVGQSVEQGVTANTVGIVTAKAGDSLTISQVVGSGFVVGATLYNDTSNSVITSASALADVITGYGKIRSVDSSKLNVARLRFDGVFNIGQTIVGESSGVTATITSVVADVADPPIGYNANVQANTITSSSLAQSLEIVDSGIGYTKNEDVTFFKVDDPSVAGEFRVIHTGLGHGQGYFRSTRGFASSNKYLFDGDYYQEYSYEVISSIPFDKYKEVLNKVLHVAGTKAFGSVLLESSTPYEINETESEITQADV